MKVEVVISQQKHHHRHLSDILGMIDESNLGPRVKKMAAAIFTEVAKAEAKIHATPIEKVHFHEVGAVDSIVDIVGTAMCVDFMGIEQVYSSPVRLGSGGFVQAAHGRLPFRPAAIEILKNYPTVLTDIPFELTTPTGGGDHQGVVGGCLERGEDYCSAYRVRGGDRDLKEAPNLLRILVGELPADAEGDEADLIETNIDDMNPEIFPYVIEKVLAEGALDAFLTPVLIKKVGRECLFPSWRQRGNWSRSSGYYLKKRQRWEYEFSR